MPKFEKIVSLLMSGDMDSAADEFVDRLFNQVTGIEHMKLKDIKEPTLVVERVSRGDQTNIRGMDNEWLEYVYGALEQVWDAEDEESITSAPGFDKFFSERNFIPTDIRGDYVGELMDFIADELDSREGRSREDPPYSDMDDLRDFDEEDCQAAWDDRYQAFKNEY